MGILKTILFQIGYFISGGIFLIFIIPVSLIFLPFKRHKKVFSYFLFGYMRWAVKWILEFLQIIEITEITGKEKVGKTGIIISNHQSYLDGFILMGNFPSVPLIKSSYKFNPFFAWIAAFFDFVPLEFSSSGLSKADENLRNRLKNKDLIYVCPEGTRSPDGNIQKFQTLAFKIANDMQIPVFPILIKYSEPIMSKNAKTFIFGKKVNIKIHVLDEIQPQKNENTAKLMQRVHSAVVKEFEKL